MKKTFVTLMLMFVTIIASAQIIIYNNTNECGIDLNGDGRWDQKVSVSHIPNNTYMKVGRNFYSEVGRTYIITQWKMYESMGQNPANFLPDPSSNCDFSQYAGVVLNSGMMAPMAGGMVAPMGMPGQASISVGGKNFGVSLSVPVRNANSGYGYTPNASVGVNVNGNYVGASVPVSIVTGKKKAQRTVAPVQRTVQPQQRTVQPQTRSQQPIQVVREMSVEEVQQMLNSGDYM